MKNFRVQIRAYGYYADFNVKSEDNENAFNDALVDKLGENDINWEKDGFSNPSKIWITYEEVINANPGQRSLQTEEGSRDRMGNAPT
jgi:hypothetical protein